MYEFGNGYPKDQAQGIAWIRKAAAQNHVDAQQELGYIYATGDGVKQDDVQAAAWFRKAATAGNAQRNTTWVCCTPRVRASRRTTRRRSTGGASRRPRALPTHSSSWPSSTTTARARPRMRSSHSPTATIAARNGDKENIAYRDEIAKPLTPEERKKAAALAAAWTVGQPMPTTVAAAGAASGAAASAAAPVKNRCSATGAMDGTRFTATNCVISLYGDQNSVAIWFNEDPITPAEAETFQTSSFASGDKGGKPRTLAQIMFCPGGGQATASAAAVKSIDINTNHAKSPLAGIQRVVEAPRDFKVERMTGDIKPGGVLSGKIVGSLDKTSFSFDFELTLPAKDAAAGMSCGK